MVLSFLKLNIPLLILIGVLFFFVQIQLIGSGLLGFLLSFVFVLTSAWVNERLIDSEWGTFTEVFFFAMFVRFIVVLVALIFFLQLEKIDEIFFTVSFIISYLYHSVTEMILFNQLLHKKSS